MAALAIEEFTDPGCPFAFSAEPARWRVEWLYGDQHRLAGDGDDQRYTCRPTPENVDEVLAWAGVPLATMEVATVCQLQAEEAREELARVAEHQPVGNDGYWALRVAEPAGA